MINMRGICKTYRGKQVETKVLHGVTLDIAEREFVAVVGRSGCGKTTLLNIIGALDTYDRGSYLFEGQEINRMTAAELTRFRNQKVGFIFQSFNLLSELTVLSNVALPLGYAGIGKAARERRVMEMLEKVGMAHRLKHSPAQLSGGEQQRVALARALVSGPKLIIADEPTGNLDEQNSHDIMRLLLSLNASGTTLLMVTHDMQLAACAGRIIHLRDGHVASSTQ